MSFPRYPAYKDADYSWIGDIPSHWDAVPNKALLRVQKREVGSAWSETELLSLTLRGVVLRDIESGDGKYPSDFSTYQLVEPGDLVFCLFDMDETPRTVGLSELSGMITAAYDVFRCNSGVDPRFVYYFYLHIDSQKRLRPFYTGLRKTVRTPTFLSIKMPLAPLAEQTAIAGFLDRETGKIDELVAEQRRLIELLKEKRQAVISHAVTKGLNPQAPLKPSGIQWLGDVPEHWRSAALKHLARPGVKTFTDGDWIESPFITSEGVRLIQTGNIGIGHYKEQGFRYVSEVTFSDLKCTEVKPRDVLICRLDGPVGRACLAPDLGVRMITSVDNAILKTADDVCPEYVVSLLSSVPWISWIDALCRVGGGFRLRVSRGQLGELRVPLPPFDEQTAIANYLASESTKFDALTAEAERAIELLQERRTALISAAVTGKIDVRDFSRGVAEHAEKTS